MDTEKFCTLLQRISMKHAPMGLTIKLDEGFPGALAVSITTKERDNPQEEAQIHSCHPYRECPDDEIHALRWIVSRAVALFEHEVLEQLLLDGERVLDPHRGSTF